MRVIRFGVEGLMNSFRIPFFRTYHKSFLAPPKTTVIGMLCNISLKSQKEFFEILESEMIELSVVINSIEGRGKDLWSYKTIDKKNRGKSVIRRDKLFIPNYTIYLKIEDEALYQEILENLKKPKNIPSLGLDDELIIICDVEEIELVNNESGRIDSLFLDKGIEYKAFVKELSCAIELPMSNVTATKFRGFDKKEKRISREVTEEFRQVEFINCEVEFEKEVKSFIDSELGHRLVLY
ncbi:MAG: CRISPR-associated protein Cas5 [Sulfurimonas sp.]|nr:CRISPR-associated protein Cas5 [Sulfurimonas sp.]